MAVKFGTKNKYNNPINLPKPKSKNKWQKDLSTQIYGIRNGLWT